VGKSGFIGVFVSGANLIENIERAELRGIIMVMDYS
jgi:hypothetical protein